MMLSFWYHWRKVKKISTIHWLLSDPAVLKANLGVIFGPDLNGIMNRTSRVTRPLWNGIWSQCLMLSYWYYWKNVKKISTIHRLFSDQAVLKANLGVVFGPDLNKIMNRTSRVTRPLWNGIKSLCMMLGYWYHWRMRRNVKTISTIH